MPKTPKYGPEYSREREFKVILEDIQSQFRTFGEGQEDLRERMERVEQKLEKLDAIEIRLGAVETEVSQIRLILRPFTATISDHEHRLTSLESRR